VLVIAEDLVCGSRIEVGQGRASPADFEDFGGEAACAAVGADPLQALLGGSADRGSD
jgi:hypothetical protein